MIRKRIVRKAIAIFLILVTLSNVFLPTVAWALTSGPTAPEATSFEPVDTTDMVNLATGDFVYNIPLLEIPGPAGGYPLSLSYHAGIQPNEDASWVGLGWTLNPGAITRTVNGYPDDQLGSIRTRQDVDTGGERHTLSLGVGMSGGSFNLSVSNDSNLGIGIGTSITIGPSIGIGGKDSGVGINAGLTTGIDGYGNSYSGVSVNLSVGQAGKDAKGLSYNIGLSTNFSSVSLNSGIGFRDNSNGRSASLLGADISSNGLKPSLSVAGYSAHQSNSNAGRMTTEGWGISTPPIPIGPLTLTLGYNYLRYYSDETSDVNLIGTLKASSTNGKDPDSWSFDSYALLDPDAAGGVIKNNDPEKSNGGSFPAYDSYNVAAQGLGGSIQPYILDNGTLFRQNLKTQNNSEYIIQYQKINNSFNFINPVNFRFKNDFSNAFTFDNVSMKILNDQTVQFESTQSTPTPAEGFNSTTRHLAGSKHIEYFTNQQIKDGIAKTMGFIDNTPNASRELSKYGLDVSSQIGGFMITNESGVTYHYALPVYAYGQVSKSFKTGKENDVFQKNTEKHPYAYTWFLTAVTGPDYVNRNPSNDGTINNSDWGYWVKFDYGLQANAFIWRNPDTGTHKDIDREIENFSYGKKELYYLDKVETASHVAIFSKSERIDGKGVANEVTGSYATTPVTECVRDPNSNANIPPLICTTTNVNPAKTLKLDRVFLLSRRDYEAGSSDLITKSVRTVSLNTDYSLVPGTSNSFVDNNINVKLGKLTLKSLSFLGKGGADLTPPMHFEYAKNPVYNKDAQDIWGFYKSDYTPMDNENLSRYVTGESSNNTDAWSLSRVRSSLGSSILVSYESDSYLKPNLYRSNLLNVKSVTPNAQYGSTRLEFHTTGFDLRDYISPNHNISLIGVISYPFYRPFIAGFQCDGQLIGQYGENYKSINFSESNSQIQFVGSNYVDVQNEQLFNDITKVLGIHSIPATLPYPKNDPSIPCYNNLGQESNLSVTYSLNPRWMGGNMSFTSSSIGTFGGGLKVASIKIESSFGPSRITRYTFDKGMTAFEPTGLDVHILQYLEDIVNNSGNPWEAIISKRQKAIDEFLIALNGQFSKLLSISREVPAPGVIYEMVTVDEEIIASGETNATKIPGKKVFEFQAFDEGIIERLGLLNTSNRYATSCKDSQGEPVPCDGSGSAPPVTCKDQFGDPIACNTLPSSTTTPVTLKDFSSWVGTLKSVTTYGATNEILERITNQYLHDNKTNTEFIGDIKSRFRNQGVITQVFNERRTVKNGNQQSVLNVLSRRDEFPLVAIGQTSVNYKTGLTQTSQNLEFDFYTGAPTKVLSTDGYGNRYLTQSVPAYSLSAYSGMTPSQISSGFAGMGLKVNNPNNKHMLTQNASTTSYKVDANNNSIGLVSASAQTWSDQTSVTGAGTQAGIWRQRANFSFTGNDDVSLQADGLFLPTSVTTFNAWNPNDAVTSGWQKNSDVRLYDVFSHALEAADINGNLAATKMSLDQTRVVATVANAGYPEFAFAGAEESPGAGGALGGGVIFKGESYTTTAHTGKSAAVANPSVANKEIGFTYSFTAKARTYHAAVWSNQVNANIAYKINGGAKQLATITNRTNRAGNWYLLEADIAVTGTPALEVWCEANGTVTFFDDFRVSPLDASMTSYVYNEWGELTHILDNNNLYTEYRYDGMGRLTGTYRETLLEGGQPRYGNQGIARVNQIQYNYGAITAGGSNSPFAVTVTASRSGTSGTITPSGVVSLRQGGDQIFTIAETCGTPKFIEVLVDGSVINLAVSSQTLYEGAQLLVSGKTLTFKNIRGDHTIQARFASDAVGTGNVQCSIVNGCRTGSFDYYTVDGCGVQHWTYSVAFNSIPSNIRPATPPNCCASNDPESSCLCTTPQQ